MFRPTWYETTFPGWSRLLPTSASIPMPMRSSDRSMSRAWASVKGIRVFRAKAARTWGAHSREIQVLFDRDDSRLARQLVEEPQTFAVLLIQRIIDILGQVNLDSLDFHVQFRSVFGGDIVRVREPVVTRVLEVLAVV